MGNKFIVMLLAFSVLINGIFGYKLNQDSTNQDALIEAVREQAKTEQQEKRVQLEKKIDDLATLNQELTKKNGEAQPEEEGTNNTVEKNGAIDLESDLRKLSLNFINGYLTFQDIYAEERKEGLREFATEDVIDRLVPTQIQGEQITEQGVTDPSATISSRLLNATVFLGEYDTVLETVEAIIQVEYETTVDGSEHQSENTLVVKIEKIDGKEKVTQFSYQLNQ
ncbi:MAG: hypothetical protein RR533_08420 [Carnobacterium sp.]